jgi:hypothetical protein
MNIDIGDSVIVKKGILEPDYNEMKIEGWQGRVKHINPELYKGNTLVTIEWDSETLKKIPSIFIEQSEEEGLDWKTMVLYKSELKKVNARDDEKQVKKEQINIIDKYFWESFGKEGSRIAEILNGVNHLDEMKCFEKWNKELDLKLEFPLSAIVVDSEENSFIKDGDKVIIISLPHIADMYGIIATVKLGKKKFAIPLCELEITDKKDLAFQLIKDYNIWFANR